MTRTEEAFLALVRAGIQGEKPTDPALGGSEWETVLELAERHKLLPLVLDAAFSLPSARAVLGKSLPPGGKVSPEATDEGRPDWRTLVLSQVNRQVVQENEFLNLILALRERGLEPMVVKGAICRKLYPKPLLRPSVDDDLLIRPEQAAAFHAALLELGLTEDHGTDDPEALWELSYHKPDSPLYIELHTCLFDPESPIFSGFNGFFADAFDAPIRERVQDVDLLTLEPNLHLLFLILHAYKHFLFSGFGLRIISDVCLFSRDYATRIDFEKLLQICTELRCHRFTAAVYRIGEKHLGIPAPAAFAALEVDEGPLLTDVLESGLHGADIDRLHSANITLSTVADDRLGSKNQTSGLRASLFPSAQKLSGSYPFLKKHPWMVPAAWTHRITGYLLHRGKYGKQSPTASLRIGRERVALLEQYDIIDQSKS